MVHKPYDHQKVEKKWQDTWYASDAFTAPDHPTKHKAYILDMFPYPSGDGLHVGHPEGYTASDIFSRYLRMQGKNVLHPMGWDAFGLPAENYAIKTGTHPSLTTKQNIATFKRQIQALGFSYDWTRELNTTDPEYYKWTQWIFLKLFEKGLAYEAEAPINWCPKDKTGLANEEVVGGKCDRCGTVVEKKNIRQWLVKITDAKYIERLLNDLDTLDWSTSIKQSQRNWIGKSEGAEIDFTIQPQAHGGQEPNFLILHGYTGRVDKNFIPNLKEQLESQGYVVQTPQLPNTTAPKEVEQVQYVIDNCTIDSSTIIVGHSLGGVVAMKVIQKINQPIAGLVLVAPAVEPEFRTGEERPFWKTFTWDYDYNRIKKFSGFRIVLSDLLEKDERAAYLGYLAKKLDAPVRETTANKSHFRGTNEPFVLHNLLRTIKVFTTRPDTLFGATYMVLSPEHPLVSEITTDEHRKAVEKYQKQASQKSDLDRTDLAKEKTGVFTGAYAINPVNNEKIPVWIADYVLASYGTGAIMAVPAHDERDHAFAKKYELPIVDVIMPHVIDAKNPPRSDKQTLERQSVHAIVHDPKTDRYLCLQWKIFPWTTFVMGGVEAGEDIIEAAKREVKEEAGYTDLHFERVIGGPVRADYFATHKDENRRSIASAVLFTLASDAREEITAKEKAKAEPVWLPLSALKPESMRCSELPFWLDRLEGNFTYSGEGLMIRPALPMSPIPKPVLEVPMSPGAAGHLGNELQRIGYDGPYEGLTSQEFRKAIVGWLEKTGNGKAATNYKLRDWVFSRQRYWGEPIPIVHCPEHGNVAVPEDKLPVLLPDVKKYEPTGTGESPLAGIKDWVNTTCPQCGEPAKRETNTMPQWAGSNWYFLRYCDPHNNKQLADPAKLKAWLPVDTYIGGAEHAVLHLLYARFIYKFLFDIGVVPKEVGDEPFIKLINQGLILAEDGQKMSKSRGNVINPDLIVREYGADSLRMFEMFMGPLQDAKPWNTRGIVGVRRFLEKVWQLQEKVQDGSELHRETHALVKQIGDDIKSFSLNTAVSNFMKWTNAAATWESVSKMEFGTFLTLLSPFAPHLAQELWSQLGHKDQVHAQSWPNFDASKLIAENVEVVVQVNGKVRDKFTVASGISVEDLKAQALGSKKIQPWLGGKTPKKIIVVKGKLVSIVI